jgi:hypothetical protein
VRAWILVMIAALLVITVAPQFELQAAIHNGGSGISSAAQTFARSHQLRAVVPVTPLSFTKHFHIVSPLSTASLLTLNSPRVLSILRC